MGVVSKYSYKLVIYYNPEVSDLALIQNGLSTVLGFDITQIGNILTMLQVKGYCITKAYNTRSQAMEEWDELFRNSIDCELVKVAND